MIQNNWKLDGNSCLHRYILRRLQNFWKSSHFFWRVNVKELRDFFQNFMAFLEYLKLHKFEACDFLKKLLSSQNIRTLSDIWSRQISMSTVWTASMYMNLRKASTVLGLKSSMVISLVLLSWQSLLKKAAKTSLKKRVAYLINSMRMSSFEDKNTTINPRKPHSMKICKVYKDRYVIHRPSGSWLFWLVL